MQIRVFGVPEKCRAMLSMAGAVLHAFCNGIYQLRPKCTVLFSARTFPRLGTGCTVSPSVSCGTRCRLFQ